MLITLITIGLIIGTGFLVKNAKIQISIKNYIFVLFGGIITLLFEPIIIALYTDGSADGGAIQIASTIFGIYFIGWSMVRMIKFKKENHVAPKSEVSESKSKKNQKITLEQKIAVGAVIVIFAIIGLNQYSRSDKNSVSIENKTIDFSKEVNITDQKLAVTSKSSEEIFKMKSECASYRSNIEEKMSDTLWTRYFIDEIFYSPIKNSCLYGIHADQDAKSYSALIIWDYLTGEMIFYRDTSLTEGQDISAIYQNSKKYLKGEENLKYSEKDWYLE